MSVDIGEEVGSSEQGLIDDKMSLQKISTPSVEKRELAVLGLYLIHGFRSVHKWSMWIRVS